MKRLSLSVNLVKKSIKAHSSLGVAFGALMYLICLTGTLSVFFEEFERWEQPAIEEYQEYSVGQINRAIGEFQQRVKTTPEKLWIVLPRESVPRMHISGDDQEWFINADGSLSEQPLEAWTNMMTSLHEHLHLPHELGTILVGILGVLLCSLTLSGLLSHPSLFKDAFRWRLGRQALTQLDLHNRLSVWAAPFYLIIALTGAFIGLIGVYGALTSVALYENDIQAVFEVVYGADPEVIDASPVVDLNNAFQTLKAVAPDVTPLFLTIHDMETDAQYLEVFVSVPERLIYSEIYRFHADGSLIDHKGFSDGAVGKQVAYSVYRLHFGHFAGFWVKVVYGLLGLALTVVCVSGINIWLVKRKFESVLNDVWVAVVWGLPLALAVAALFSFYGMAPLTVFGVTQIVTLIFSIVIKQPDKARWFLIAALVLSLSATVLARTVGVLNESVTPVFYGVNLSIFAVIIVLIWMSVHQWKHLKTRSSSPSEGKKLQS